MEIDIGSNLEIEENWLALALRVCLCRCEIRCMSKFMVRNVAAVAVDVAVATSESNRE